MSAAEIQVRSYGTSGRLVIVLHGGPGGQGSMAPVARELGDSFRVLEPFQRGSSASVAGHVADLHEVVVSRSGGTPAVVGHSWGAMLALAYAAAHPGFVGPLVLIGCGTFDLVARSRLGAILEERMNAGLRRRFDRLAEDFPDRNERHRARGELTLRLYSYDLATADQETVAVGGEKSHETWQDMMRLQKEGVYPAAFAAIKSPLLMIHGAVDPHPGHLIRASLEPHLRQLEYYELERCGHYPWLEKAAGEKFFSVLRRWLVARTPQGRS